MSAQLLFKDHEVIEAQRSRAEKEEQLKNALAEANALREEVDRLKKSRQPGGELKRARDEGLRDQAAGKSIETRGTNSALPPRSRPDVTQHSGRDPWAPPWIPERSSEGGAQGKKTVTGLHNTTGEKAPEGPRPPSLRHSDESLGIDTLRVRADSNTGCEPGGESLRDDKAQDNKFPRGDSTRAAAGASSSARADPEGGSHAAANGRTGEHSRVKEMYFALQQVWGLAGIKSSGPSLLSKLYASCRQDLYTLFSSRESQGSVSVEPHSSRDMEEQIGNDELSEALHSALAQVANGLAPTDFLLAPLLKFCNHQDNDNVMESSLRVLHCVLQHDSACRQKLLVRRRPRGEVEEGDAPIATGDITEKLESSGEGWFIKSVPSGKDDGQRNRVVVFSSPRIRCYPVQLGSDGGATVDPCGDAVGNGGGREKEQKPSEDRLNHHSDSGPGPGPDAGQGQDDHEVERLPGNTPAAGPAEGKDLNPFVKLMMHLSLSGSSSPDVRYEAVSILGVLVVNTEAFEERAMFAPILFQWRIHLLLRESAGVEMQLQAVRIIHHLLYCPLLFQQLCCSTADGDDDGEGNEATVQQQPVRVEEKDVAAAAAGAADMEDETESAPIAADHDCEHETKGGQKAETSNATAVAAAAAKGARRQRDLTPLRTGRAKVLRGLMECLKCFSGGAPQAAVAGQEHALHRSVIRLLTFIALSGDAGVAYLVQASSAASEEDQDDAPPSQGGRGNHKMEGPVGGESGSDRQSSVGKGSGSGLGGAAVIKGPDHLTDRGGEDGIEVGVAEESLDESEKGQNIPQNLVGLIDTELRIEKREGWKEPSVADERDRLIHEAVTLLCHLASHAVQSSVVLGYLTSYKYIARLTINVTSALITRKSRSQQTGGAGQRLASGKASELAELARVLKKEVLRRLAESNLLG